MGQEEYQDMIVSSIQIPFNGKTLVLHLKKKAKYSMSVTCLSAGEVQERGGAFHFV